MVTKVSAEGVIANATSAATVNTTATLLPATPNGTSATTAAAPSTTRGSIGLPAVLAALAGVGLLAARRR